MTAAEIAELLGMALSTVSLILKRVGLGRRSRLEPLEPVNRYEHQRPGELVHLDIKKLARFDRPGHRLLGRGRYETGAGFEYLHVCVDDYSRLAYTELLPDERGTTVAAFLLRAASSFAAHGITIKRVLTDNGSGYLSATFAERCRQLQIKHSRTRPRRPQTTAKPSVSSRPCSANGPTHASTTPATNEPPPSPPGSATTTTADPTAASATSRPPPDWNNLSRNYT